MNTKDELIEATRELLWEKGYTATSPRDIQKRANAGQGSMYHHFSGKEELARAAIEKSAEALRTLAEKDLPEIGTSYERILLYMRRERKILRGCPMGRLIQDPDIVNSDLLRKPIEESFSWAVDRIARVLAEGMDKGEFIRHDPAAVASTIVSVIQGAYVLARAANDERPYRDAVRGLEALLSRLRTDTGSPDSDGWPCSVR